MKKGIAGLVGLAVLLGGAGLTASPALAKCGTDCKKALASEFKVCKAGCAKGKLGKACRKACSDEFKADKATCKAATNPTPPGCGETTTTTSTTTTTTVPTCANGGIPCDKSCGGACGGTTCVGPATVPGCTFVHCGSPSPICAVVSPPFTHCTADTDCPAGHACVALEGQCGGGMFDLSSCGAICAE